MTAVIHPSAIVYSGAELDVDVEVGPYAIVGANVRLASGVKIGSHAVVDGYTTVGEGTRIFPFASVGGAPQDLKYHGEPSTLVIGQRNVIREYVTLHPGTESGEMTTIIGDENLFMVSSHVAHDCVVGSRNVVANGVALAGHVHVGDGAIIGGLAAIHQFSRIGDMAMISGGSMVPKDVPPFAMVQGDRAKLRGINLIGLKRAGFSREEVSAIKKAYRRLFFQKGNVVELAKSLPEELLEFAAVRRMQTFALQTRRGFITPRSIADTDDDI
ncbi:MAG: acyl-ACP--UDP-N-acetylglucosamine O-acyltransferase [bacterium]|nr:acyl-ACP--UDP-N-acetylglucosamine O-acyltransferase [bacterium]